MKLGVGLSTYNRPEYFKQSIESGIKHILDIVDVFYVYNDGSDKKFEKEYQRIYKELPKKIVVIDNKENHGVGYAKNRLLEKMMADNCDYMWLWEDDIIIKDEKAVTGYIDSAKNSGFSHLCFAYHGPMNKEPMYKDDWLEYHGACIGAWCMYTKEIIEKVGYFDENFHNAWEHVELTKRIGDEGFCPPFGLFIDAAGSKYWLEEIPDSIDNSAIRPRKDWKESIDKGLEYWRKKDGVGLPKL